MAQARAFVGIIGAILPFIYVFINYRMDVNQMVAANLQGFQMTMPMLLIMEALVWILIMAVMMSVVFRITGSTKVY